MKSGGGRVWVTGPFVIAGSVMLAMTVVLFSTQMIVDRPTAAGWLPQMRAHNNPDKRCAAIGSLPRSPLFYNITGRIMEEMERNGTGPCYEQHTNSTKVIGFPENVEVLTLSTNVVHKFWLQSYNSAGERRCAGGDYYELDLSSSLWKSRPPVEDLQNGTYAVQFMVPDIYAGSYNFSAFLLFDAYHGLDFHAERWSIMELTAFLYIKFVTPANLEANSTIANASMQQPMIEADNLLALKRCQAATDFKRHEWSGRWSRPLDNDTCIPDQQGRYSHCFSNSEEIPCKNPSWCSGDVSKLESVGWSYSAHCAFHIFEPQEAWDCLAGRWLFFWGDSNHQDTIRNMLTCILQIELPPGRDLTRFSIDRNYQNVFRNPDNVDQEVRITNYFNGHYHTDSNAVGLDSLQDSVYRRYLNRFFEGKRYPDTVIMNSGLHDGLRHHDLPAYVKSVDYALTHWSNLFSNLTGKPPQLIYRTTVAPAGFARRMQSNVQKLEVYNQIMTEKVHVRFPEVKFVDEFDMTFPFHYNNNYSDGGHYGRPPDGQHFYFVDITLGHILLNAMCPQKERLGLH